MIGEVEGGDIKYIFVARHRLPHFENGVPSPVAHVAIDQGLSERHDARGSFGRYQSAMKGSASKLPPLMQARAAGGQRLSALAALRGSNPAPSPTADGLKHRC
jgi:hypothetical protein